MILRVPWLLVTALLCPLYNKETEGDGYSTMKMSFLAIAKGPGPRWAEYWETEENPYWEMDAAAIIAV